MSQATKIKYLSLNFSSSESAQAPNALPPNQPVNIGPVDKPVRDFGPELEMDRFGKTGIDLAENENKAPPEDIVKVYFYFDRILSFKNSKNYYR